MQPRIKTHKVKEGPAHALFVGGCLDSATPLRLFPCYRASFSLVCGTQPKPCVLAGPGSAGQKPCRFHTKRILIFLQS